MANGIDWFRWHHGSVNDPKFGLVAKKAGARVGDVIAVWALVLEQASANIDRGACSDLDYEATDFLLGADDGTTERIVKAMRARGLITDDRVTRWEDRQPKRERVDTTATERKRAQRERERDSNRDSGTDGETTTVTPCHAESHHVTPREEKSREEKKEAKSKTKAPAAPTFDPLPDLLAHGVAQQTASDWLALRKAKRAAVTPTALRTIVSEAQKAGMSLDAALSVCCSRGWAGFEAEWVLRDQRAGPAPDPAKAHLSKAGQATARNMEAWLERKRQEQEQSHG